MISEDSCDTEDCIFYILKCIEIVVLNCNDISPYITQIHPPLVSLRDSFKIVPTPKHKSEDNIAILWLVKHLY